MRAFPTHLAMKSDTTESKGLVVFSLKLTLNKYKRKFCFGIFIYDFTMQLLYKICVSFDVLVKKYVPLIIPFI